VRRIFMNNSDKTFLHFELRTQAVAIGERVKGGIFRPCIETIPTSTLKGSFRDHLGLESVVSIGFFKKETYDRAIFTYSPFDTLLKTSKLPISLEYLKPKESYEAVVADIYVVKDDTAGALIRSMPAEISIGALKSKDFGRCKIEYVNEVKPDLKVGYLKGRLLEEESSIFCIVKTIKACYGYLFYPTSRISGVYKRALFEGSIIKGPDILIDEVYEYDYD
jgi:hypothetical protein